MSDKFRFRDFEFDPEIGQLVHYVEATEPLEKRLAPQPAQLLQLLLEKSPGIVSRDLIRETIWPDVQVDFDRSLHFCIRQVRTALEESAADPVFIETIPRRGYRWLVPVAKVGDENSSNALNLQSVHEEADNTSKAASHSGIKMIPIAFMAAGLIAVLLTITAISTMGGNWQSSKESKFRVAVMPFQTQNPDHAFADNDIALQLVDRLTNQSKLDADIIGPTTTSKFTEGYEQLFQLVKEKDIDYVVNGKFSSAEGESKLLTEIIKADDGAHVWVKYFDADNSSDQISQQIAQGLAQVLKNEQDK